MTKANPVLRAKILDFARSNFICTCCFSRKPKKDCVTCPMCLARKAVQKKRSRLKHGNDFEHDYYMKHREKKIKYSREYKAKHKRDVGDIEKAVRALEKL